MNKPAYGDVEAGAAFLAALGTDDVTKLRPAPPKDAPARLQYIRIPGVLDLSFSKRASLNKCPRYFKLRETEGLSSFTPSAHTAFGHSYGAGIQTFFKYADSHGLQAAEEFAQCAVLAWWDTYNIYDADPRNTKTIWACVAAVEKFCRNEGAELHKRYKVAIHPKTGRSLIELLYYIDINGAYSDQGHIDLVLEDRNTGELMPVEVKTGSKTFNPSDWSNSSQTIGYSVVLQHFGLMHKQQAAYYVLYLCYDAVGRELQQFYFTRPLTERAEWLASLMFDVQIVAMYNEAGVWPKRGTACRTYKRDCEFYGVCDLTHMKKPDLSTYQSLDLDKADFYCTIQELIEGAQQELETSGDGAAEDFELTLNEYKPIES